MLSKLKKKKTSSKATKHLTIALAGNANVGKSVIFNQLTGSNQIIGNWPGKTVDRAEGTLRFEDYEIKVIDLPGIYSFSTFSMEELVSRDYIALEKPDVVINVLDAGILERNLFFTIQLLEMEAPLVVCLNQIDEALKKGMIIDRNELEKILGAPVMFTVATRGEGVYDLIKTAVEVAEKKPKPKTIKYKPEVEARIQELARLMEDEKLDLKYPNRWIAIKLLEGDGENTKLVASKSHKVADFAEILGEELSTACQEPCFSIIASERYSLASLIVSQTVQQTVIKRSFSEKLDSLTTHRVFGYFTSAGVIVGLLLWTFVVGGFLSGLIANALSVI
jgi:ferrous iron transport protein B